jgi:hypothetical protein
MYFSEKRNVVEVESEEEELPKHPALATNKIPTPVMDMNIRHV